MAARIICFASAKGGSGKTVVCASIGTFLAGLGMKVLLIDMDAATNGLSLLYLEKLTGSRKQLSLEGGQLERGLSAVLPKGMFEMGRDKQPSPFKIEEGLDLIPAAYVMRQTEDTAVDTFTQMTSDAINFFLKAYDYILLDAQSGSDRFAQVAIGLSHDIVVVSEFDPISVEGIDRLKHLFQDLLPYNRTWILFNKILPEFLRSL